MTSIIIPLHNALTYTAVCIESIRRTTADYEIIVINNGSTDGTRKWLADQPDIVIIENPENRGFPKAVNQGIEQAKGDMLCLLNNDTVVGKNWLARLIGHIERGEADIIGPMTNFCLGHQHVALPEYQTIAAFESTVETVYRNNRGQCRRADWIIGFCMVFRKEIINTAGMFDERYGIGNSEDIDFCYTAGAAGYKIAYAPDVYIHHFGSVTHKLLHIDYETLLLANAELLFAKHGAKSHIFKRLNASFLSNDVAENWSGKKLLNNLISEEMRTKDFPSTVQ